MSVKRRRWWRIVRWFIPFLVIFVGAAGYWGYQYQRGNFHPVTPGQAYRSAQLDATQLRDYIRDHGIKSVISLRTQNEDAPWYQDEIATCEALGVEHRSLPLRATIKPTPEQVSGLLELYETLPRPVLLHCQAGADRAGIASALWKVAVDGESKEVASSQLSLRYGHVPVGPTTVLDEFFEDWDVITIGDPSAEEDAPDALETLAPTGS